MSFFYNLIRGAKSQDTTQTNRDASANNTQRDNFATKTSRKKWFSSPLGCILGKSTVQAVDAEPRTQANKLKLTHSNNYRSMESISIPSEDMPIVSSEDMLINDNLNSLKTDVDRLCNKLYMFIDKLSDHEEGNGVNMKGDFFVKEDPERLMLEKLENEWEANSKIREVKDFKNNNEKKLVGDKKLAAEDMIKKIEKAKEDMGEAIKPIIGQYKNGNNINYSFAPSHDVGN